MRYIQKPITTFDVPASLRFPIALNFENSKVSRLANTTQSHRNELLVEGKYDAKHDDRYKSDDVRDALIKIYSKKCAYCEQRSEFYHVEHYRPKKTYYWLAFSWDNLLYVCPICNFHKGEDFEIQGSPATIASGFVIPESINNLGATYDALEHPKLINPEVTNPEGQLDFHKDGNVTSTDPRFVYTIETCHLHRDDLKYQRKRILDRFVENIRDYCLDYDTEAERDFAIKKLKASFEAEAADPEENFTAFRKYAAQHWLIEEILSNLS